MKPSGDLQRAGVEKLRNRSVPDDDEIDRPSITGRWPGTRIRNRNHNGRVDSEVIEQVCPGNYSRGTDQELKRKVMKTARAKRTPDGIGNRQLHGLVKAGAEAREADASDIHIADAARPGVKKQLQLTGVIGI